MKRLLQLSAVCFVLIFASSLFAATYVPQRINASQGDVILNPGSGGGTLGGLFNVLHVYWSHSGMLIDNGYNIRHNTMGDPAYDTNWLGCPTTFQSDSLRNGMPGMITENINAALNSSHNFKVAGGVILKPSSGNEAAYRPFLQTVGAQMAAMDAYYRPNAYTNYFQMNTSTTRVKGQGNHCSGTIEHMIWMTGVPKQMNLPYHDSPTMYSAAYQLWWGVHDAVDAKVNGDFCGSIVCSSSAAHNMAFQTVNTFGFDQASTSNWFSYINGPNGYLTSIAPAPDHLMMNSFTNPLGYNTGQQNGDTSYYDVVVDVQVIEGYYM